MSRAVPAPRAAVDQVVTLADLTAVHQAAAARLVFAMREEGASWREVAAEFGIAPQNAHKRWAAALAEPVALEVVDGGARFRHLGTGLRWDPRRETPLQAAHRDRDVAAYLLARVATAAGITAGAGR